VGRNAFHLDSNAAALYVGTSGNEGDIIVRDAGGRDVFHLNADNGALYVGVSGNEGDLIVRDGAGRTVFHMNGDTGALYIGADGNEGDVIVRDGDGNETIHLNGGNGDIILSNADAAEDFALADEVEAPPGSVMVLGMDGALRPCSTAYDQRVVGVVAGAGARRPGIVLDRQSATAEVRVPISMMGKAACRVDARFGAVAVGDLLTSSPSEGCAMRVRDSLHAPGSVIGKALTPLENGKGLVEMLICLQ
jgi:hypothetical protein